MDPELQNTFVLIPFQYHKLFPYKFYEVSFMKGEMFSFSQAFKLGY